MSLPPGGSRQWHVVADVELGPGAGGGSSPQAGRPDRGRCSDRAVGEAGLGQPGPPDGRLRCPAVHGGGKRRRASLRQRGLQRAAWRLLSEPVQDARRATSPTPSAHSTRSSTGVSRELLESLPETLEFAGAGRVGQAGRRSAARTPLPRVPAAHLQPPPRRPEPAVEPLRHPAHGRRRRRAILNYEGNWRDIFQNWEALALSFPDFVENMIAKFVNASTVDGYNPYRITPRRHRLGGRRPGRPVGHIGYWGDHQIIYLLKLLELSRGTTRSAWRELLARDRSSPTRTCPTASSPTRSCSTTRATRSSSTTPLARAHRRRGVADLGADGKLRAGRRRRGLPGQPGSRSCSCRVLAKLSNLVAGRRHLDEHAAAGVERRQQRARRQRRLDGDALLPAPLLRLPARRCSRQTTTAGRTRRRRSASWLRETCAQRCVGTATVLARGPIDADAAAARCSTALGEASGRLPRGGLRERLPVRQGPCAAGRSPATCCTARSRRSTRASAANRREDGLYHAYNLLELAADGASAASTHLLRDARGPGRGAELRRPIRAGEAAGAPRAAVRAATCTAPTSTASCSIRTASCPGFLEKNADPRRRRSAPIPLLRDLLAAGDDRASSRATPTACYRFHADFRNGRDLGARRSTALAPEPLRGRGRGAGDRGCRVALYETVFDHQSFTGRSGTMFGYEGLGCIYWHMVVEAAARGAGGLLRGARAGDAAGRVAGGSATLYYRDPRRPRLQQDAGRVRRLPDRSLLAHARRTAAPSSRA